MGFDRCPSRNRRKHLTVARNYLLFLLLRYLYIGVTFKPVRRWHLIEAFSNDLRAFYFTLSQPHAPPVSLIFLQPSGLIIIMRNENIYNSTGQLSPVVTRLFSYYFVAFGHSCFFSSAFNISLIHRSCNNFSRTVTSESARKISDSPLVIVEARYDFSSPLADVRARRTEPDDRGIESFDERPNLPDRSIHAKVRASGRRPLSCSRDSFPSRPRRRPPPESYPRSVLAPRPSSAPNLR